jgi:uncharacterized membrane protein HdeD (DUF308 family)
MNDRMEADPQLKPSVPKGEVQVFARYWWLNFIRGIAALLLGIGLLLPFEVLLEAERVQTMLFQFIGIYLLVSGVMSLIWGLSNRRRFGLWIVAAALGLVGGIAFFLRSTLETYFSPTLLTILFGLIMLLAGLIHVLGGFRLGQRFGRRWTWGHEFLGLVEIIIGILVLLSLFLTVENLRIILSFWGIIAGVGLIADGFRLNKLKRSQEASLVSHE